MLHSVLDLAFVTTRTPPSQALRNTLALAGEAEALGYHRYWTAEHHNLPSVASSAPEVLIARIAAGTTTIRVGSGGIMLPNHAPLMIAERFKTLEALYPGRIDLGIGRAPGTDQVTSYALRHRQTTGRGRRFPRAPAGTAAVRDRRFSRAPSVPRDRRDAVRCALAAGVPARLERLRRRTGGADGAGLRLRASFRQLRRCGGDALLSRHVRRHGLA